MKCKYCVLEFEELKGLRSHMAGHHPAEWKKFQRDLRTFDAEKYNELTIRSTD